MPRYAVYLRGSALWWTGHGWSSHIREALAVSYSTARRLAISLRRETGLPTKVSPAP